MRLRELDLGHARAHTADDSAHRAANLREQPWTSAYGFTLSQAKIEAPMAKFVVDLVDASDRRRGRDMLVDGVAIVEVSASRTAWRESDVDGHAALRRAAIGEALRRASASFSWDTLPLEEVVTRVESMRPPMSFAIERHAKRDRAGRTWTPVCVIDVNGTRLELHAEPREEVLVVGDYDLPLELAVPFRRTKIVDGTFLFLDGLGVTLASGRLPAS